MHFLVGWLIGREIAEGAGTINRENNNALWGLFWWAVIISTANFAAHSNIGPDYSYIGGLAAAIAILGFSVHRPASSPFKTMMLSSITYVATLCFMIAAGYVAIVIGWGVISGQIKQEGLASLPWVSIGGAALCASVCAAINFTVGFITARDEARLQRQSRQPDRHQQPEVEPEPQPEAAGAKPQEEPQASAPSKDQWWAVLEINQSCTLQEAEAAARNLLKAYHPDQWMNAPPGLRAEATRQTQRIVAALVNARAYFSQK